MPLRYCARCDWRLTRSRYCRPCRARLGCVAVLILGAVVAAVAAAVTL